MCYCLAKGSVARIRRRVKTRVCHIQLGVVKAPVTFHEGCRGAMKSDSRGARENIVDELSAVGLLKFDGLPAAHNIVVVEHVMLGPPGVCHVRRVGFFVRVDVEPIFRG